MSFEDLVRLMETLRGEKGCPWDKEQTLSSLRPFLIEEAYEVIEAIEHDDPEKLKEELGDLLFHIVFISKVCSDMGKFGIEDVIEYGHRKMTRRHPHVFGPGAGSQGTASRPSDSDKGTPTPPRPMEPVPVKPSPPNNADTTEHSASPRDSADVLKRWYEIKREERARKGSRSLMDGIPHHLPALQKAQKAQRRAAEVGFDWEKADDVLEKIAEEMRELREVISRRERHAPPTKQDAHRLSDEIGDILFSVVNLSRFLKVDAEGALRGSVAKFMDRFREMERQAAARRKTLNELSLKQMDEMWEAVKAQRRGSVE